MAIPYHIRFAAALRATLPEGFTVESDKALVTAAHSSGAALIAWTPRPENRKLQVHQNDVDDWITLAARKVREYIPAYTDAAQAAAEKMLAALEAAWLIEEPSPRRATDSAE